MNCRSARLAAPAAALFFLVAAGAGWALPPGLSRHAGTWFEAGLGVAWSPARDIPLLGWRFSFQIDSPIAFSLDTILSASGGYATFNCIYFYNPGIAGENLTVPLSVGIGLSRIHENISFAVELGGGASWYPAIIPGPSPGDWVVGFGAEIGAGVYLLSWGIEPVLSAHLLTSGNLSAGDPTR